MPNRHRPRPDIRGQALRLLARREHSRLELQEKLRRSGFEDAAIGILLDALVAEDLLSDRRFADAYARARVERGYGPRRIAFELRERGVEPALIDAALRDYASEWVDRARRQVLRRFGAQPPADFRERARRMRFLERRGFPADVVRDAVM